MCLICTLVCVCVAVAHVFVGQRCLCISEHVAVSVPFPQCLWGHLCVCESCVLIAFVVVPCVSARVPELTAVKIQREILGQLGMLSPRVSVCSVLS